MKALSTDSQKLRDIIYENFDHDEVFDSILDAGLQARDLFHEAQDIVAREGLTVQGDRGGIKAHPLLSVIRDARAQFLASLKQLKIDTIEEQSQPVGRPTVYQKYAKSGRF